MELQFHNHLHNPSNEYLGLISFRIDWFNLFAIQKTLESSPASQFKGINSLALSHLYMATGKTIALTTFVGKLVSLLFNILSRLAIAFLPKCKFSSIQSFSRVQLFATPWTAAYQASLSITNSWSVLKLMSIQLVMPSNHFIFCHSLLLLPSTFPSIRVFPNESVLCIRWPKYWSFSFSISPSNEYSGLISVMID